MISEMEGRQNKMFEAMAEVQQSSIAAIHASASPDAAKMKPMVSSVLCSQGDATKEVLVERANVAMLKLNGILKSKNDGKRAEGPAVLIRCGHCLMKMMRLFARSAPLCAPRQ
jgi:hypothetical protein